MEMVQEILKTVGGALGMENLTLWSLLRVAIMVLAGWLVIRVLMGMADRLLERSKGLSAIRVYIRSTLRVFLWFLLALMLAGTLGIEVTSIIAMLRDRKSVV